MHLDLHEKTLPATLWRWPFMFICRMVWPFPALGGEGGHPLFFADEVAIRFVC